MNEKYFSVLKRLYQTNRFKTKKVNLSNLLMATSFFSFPQQNLNFIHVTGTNGKGSVCKKLSKAFEYSGYKTGLYISPHITSFRERIQINSNYIEKEFIIEHLESIYKILDKTGIDLTYFEIVTLLSLIYFKDNKIDIGIIEVGLGGNLDATNIIDPLISVITSIGLDHTDSLGYTQNEIAEKKAGIIKMNKPVVLGPDCFPKEVIIKKANETNSEIYYVKYNNNMILDFENENKAIVKKVMEVIKKNYKNLFNIRDEDILKALNSRQPCRKENVVEVLGKELVKQKIVKIFEKNLPMLKKHFCDDIIIKFQSRLDKHFPQIILDVGHNPHGLEKLMLTIKNEFPTSNLNVICGFSAHKDIAENIRTICSFSKKIYFISPQHPRILSFEDLKGFSLEFALQNYIYDKNLIEENEWTKGSVELNLILALINSFFSREKEIIIICGSFFIMNDARKSLGYSEEEDPFELNEFSGNVKFSI